MVLHSPMRTTLSFVVIILTLGACASHQSWPAMGRPRDAEPITPERLATLESNLAAARADYDADPRSEDAAIWYGRRLGYLGRFEQAIDIYTKGLRDHPQSYRLLRHRGHRYITLRWFDDAARDLTRAAELIKGTPDAIEPDGAPGPTNAARSTDHSNIYYHLGLAHYLRGDFAKSNDAFARRNGLAAFNDDMLVSTAHWRYLALRRLGREREAKEVLSEVGPTPDVRENNGYLKICRMYQDARPMEHVAAAMTGDPGYAYAVAMALLLEGHPAESERVLRRIVAETSWVSFGHIAAEAELARLPHNSP